MSIVGFIDDVGALVPFDDLVEKYRDHAFTMPLPVLLKLSDQKVVYDQFRERRRAKRLPHIDMCTSPTATLESPRIAALGRMYKKFITPNKAMTTELGSMAHHAIERKALRLMERHGNMEWIPESNMLWQVDDGLWMPMQIDLLEFPNSTYCNIHDWKFYAKYKLELAQNPDEWEEGGKMFDVRLQLSAYHAAVTEGGLQMVTEYNIETGEREPTGETNEMAPTPVQAVYAHLAAKESLRIKDEWGDETRLNSLRVPVDVLTPDQTRAVFLERIVAHRRVTRVGADVISGRLGTADAERELPKCSDEQKWLGKGQWEIWRTQESNPKRASYVYSEERMPEHVAKASAYREWGKIKNDPKKSMQYDPPRYVPGEPKRCADWCDYAPVCAQLKREHPAVFERVERLHKLSVQMKDIKDVEEKA